MRYARVKSDSKIYYTVVREEGFFPLNGDYFDYSEISSEPLKGDVEILAPIMPSKVVALGLNYSEHIQEFHAGETPVEPVIFIKPDTSIIGPGEPILRPRRSERVDYEAELAFVISKECRKVSEENAMDYIFGYTCLNDVTARDLQKLDGQWTRAKGFNTFCPIGPYIVTDINPSNLEVKAILNGEVKQNGNTAQMINNISRTLAYISSIMTLKQGDIISTGTPSGIGGMKTGDVIEIYVESVGSLINPVIDEK